jgi:hypothetical protein
METSACLDEKLASNTTHLTLNDSFPACFFNLQISAFKATLAGLQKFQVLMKDFLPSAYI